MFEPLKKTPEIVKEKEKAKEKSNEIA